MLAARRHLPAALILLSCLPVAAQPPRPIAAPDIADRYAQTAALLRATTQHTQTDARIEEVRRGLPEVIAGIRDLTAYSRQAIRLPSAVEDADEILGNWRPVTSRLDLWSDLLRQSVIQLEADRASLALAEQQWNLTLTAESALPAEVANLVSTTLQSVRAAQSTVESRRADLIALQTTLAGQRIETDTVLAELRALEIRQRRGLLTFDSPPLWAFTSAPRLPATPDSYFRFSPESGSLRREVALGTVFSLAAYFALILLARVLLGRLRSRVLRWQASPDENIQALALALGRPFSSAVFLATAVIGLIVSAAPYWIYAMAGLLLLVPSLRLLPGLMARGLERPFYLVIFLLVIEETLPNAPHSALWFRPAWFALQLAATAALWWITGLLRARAVPGLWPALFRGLTLAAALAAALAALANLLGLFQLSQLLTRVVLLSLYTAGIIRGTIVILTGLALAGLRADRLNAVASFADRRQALESRLIGVLHAAGLAVFLAALLSVATLLDPFRAAVNRLLALPFGYGSLSLTPYRFLAFALTVAAAFLLSSLLRLIIEIAVYPRTSFQAGQRDAFSKIIHYLVLAAGFLTAFAAAGVDLSHIAILAGGLSVGIGLGLQNLVNNFVSGLILLFERPLQVGDVIAVGPTTGTVRNIGIRASVIRTFEGADVTVPNGELVSSDVTNWSHADARRRVDIKVPAAYGADARHVMAILADVAREHPLVLQDLETNVLFEGFGDSSQDFILRVWIDKAHWLAVATELRARITDAFAAANIEIPFPQREMRLRADQTLIVPWPAPPPPPKP